MNRISTKKIALNGTMVALTFLATYFTRIPTPLPGGYFNLGDAVIIITAVILGRKSGLLAGAVGSALADIAFGGFIFAPVTFIVKGIEGYAAGTLANPGNRVSPCTGRILWASAAGAFIMVAGYFLAEAFILGLFDREFGLAAAVLELVPNIIQGGLSAVLGYITSAILIKVDVYRYVS
jgi:uncharacterized membrane protein